MMGGTPCIDVEPVGVSHAVVRLPPFFWLYRDLRKAFRRSKPGPEVYTFTLRGKHAAQRLSVWAAAADERAWRFAAAREQARRDAEWEAAGE